MSAKKCAGTFYFYPRSPCGERPAFYHCRYCERIFLSTLSLRRATVLFSWFLQPFSYFYPRSPCGERHSIRCAVHRQKEFLSTLSLRRATLSFAQLSTLLLYFYPRSPCGERLGRYYVAGGACVFLSTLSLRRATWPLHQKQRVSGFLSTLSLRRATTPPASAAASSCYFYPRSPCGERPLEDGRTLVRLYISIHALLAESDALGKTAYGTTPEISIHALLAESDSRKPTAIANTPKFLSTLSLRRATVLPDVYTRIRSYFYPRSPCGERLQTGPAEPCVSQISIHALLAESDSVPSA